MNNGPQNVIMGDENFGTDLPETEIPEQDLASEKNAARFSRTKEFKVLKDHLESRILYYQTFMPNGRSIAESEQPPSGAQWQVANLIIAEFKAVIQAYEDARDAVKGQSEPRS
jgi:hypothetical protein